MDKVDAIIHWFKTTRPVAISELHYRDAFQLLVAVMLSAQCTDKRVNMVTPMLLSAYPTPQQLAAAKPEEVYPYIRSVSYPNSKSRHLVAMAQCLMSEFDGQVPAEVADLERLPGVGRKTANVVASVVFEKPVIAVDTHVFRVAHRLGLSQGKTPLAVEQDLNQCFPPSLRAIAHHWLILHGRYICMARKPQCDSCGLASYCDYALGLNAAADE